MAEQTSGGRAGGEAGGTVNQTDIPPELSGPSPATGGRAFRFLLCTAAAEGVGDAVTRTVFPILAVAVLGMGPGFVGALNAVGIAAFVLLGVPIGAMVDRRRRPGSAMGAASLLRCLALLVLAAAAFSGWLSAPLLAGVAVLIGVADVVFTTAQTTLIPAVADGRGLKHAYSRLAITGQATSAGAAAGAGAGLALLGMPLVLAATAAAYALSRLFQLGLPRSVDREAFPGAEQGDNPGPAQGGREGEGRRRGPGRLGFALLRNSPALRSLTLSACLTNAAAMVGNTVLPVYVLRDLALAPALYAVLGVFGAAGAVLGAATAPRLSSRFGLSATRSGAALLSVPAVLLVVACTWLPGPEMLWLALEFLLWAFLVSVSAVAGSEVLPRTVPPGQLATVAAAQRTFTLGVMPPAALLAGFLAAWAGMVPVFCLWVLLAGTAAVPILRTGALRQFR